MTPGDRHLAVFMMLRWLHLISAFLWVGMSFFLNFVISPVAKRWDPAVRAKQLPDILDGGLFWIRVGSMLTYITGWCYLLYKCYGESNVGFHGENGLARTSWGQWISIGVILGTVMLANVWWVIWPAQKKLIGWMRSGEKNPNMPALAAQSDKISKINVYLAIPLIFTMGAASHLPVMNAWIVGLMFVGGFALAAHLFMIANRIHRLA